MSSIIKFSFFKRKYNLCYKYNEHVEIGKQSPLKQEWKEFLKSSSLFVRNYNYNLYIIISYILKLNNFYFNS